MHQFSCFCENSKLIHETFVHKIISYLKTTENIGMIFKPGKIKGTEFCVDAYFADGWNSIDAENSANDISRTGYVIIYYG